MWTIKWDIPIVKDANFSFWFLKKKTRWKYKYLLLSIKINFVFFKSTVQETQHWKWYGHFRSSKFGWLKTRQRNQENHCLFWSLFCRNCFADFYVRWITLFQCTLHLLKWNVWKWHISVNGCCKFRLDWCNGIYSALFPVLIASHVMF